MEITISDQEFELFRAYIYKVTGIALNQNKASLVQGRLSKRLRELNYASFAEYYKHILEDESETWRLVSAISTNVTSFFREESQWNYLAEYLAELRLKKQQKRLRIWSSACSSGEEPYSIAMFLAEQLPDFLEWDIKILATDISVEVLRKAKRGIYSQKSVESLPAHLLNKYFHRFNEAREPYYAILDEIKSKIIFRIFNLIHGDFSLFNKPFDMIFCRNVMIYFDPPSQQALISRFARLLRSGDLLLVGRSEALTKHRGDFIPLKQSIYKKV
ncbi:MAG: CheR family methyltransferase [Wolinella sp.]